MDHFDIDFRFEPSADAAEFSGYAVIWGERNAHSEIVERGAFAKTLAAHKAAGTRPVMFWSHNREDIIGVWNEIREDEKGLFVSGKLLTGISRGKEVHEMMKAGAVNGLSIGFRVPAGGEQRRAGVRYIREIALAEISVVGLPSAGGARITAVRSNGRSSESAAAFIEACRKAKCALTSQRS
jgi:HK97 family phage prohead protease